MTVSIRQLLGALPSGGFVSLDWQEVAAHLRKEYVDNQAEKERQERAKCRTDLYHDAGDEYVKAIIDLVFEKDEVAEMRKKFVQLAKSNNISRRVIRETSTIYSEAPVRKVKGERDQERYAELLRRVKQDRVMREFDRLLHLQGKMLLGFRVEADVATDDDSKRSPRLDVVGPEDFWIIRHPLMPKRAIGYLFKLRISGPKIQEAGKPAYLVWTDHEYFKLDKACRYIEDSVVEHGFSRMPWILASVDPLDDAGQPNDQTGEDLVAAHLSVWFEYALMLKESKSQNRQAIFSGDLGETARGQAADSDLDVELQDGVNVQTIDRGVNAQVFLAVADAIRDRTAANRGIPASVLRHDGATSGYEIELRRIGIREQRKEHEPVVRDVERELVEVQAMVLERDMPSLWFSPDGWSIRLGEVEAPRSPAENNATFEAERRLGLTDTFEEVAQRDGISEEQAIQKVLHRVSNELLRNLMMRPLAEISGSANAPSDGASGMVIEDMLSRLDVMARNPAVLDAKDIAALRAAVSRFAGQSREQPMTPPGAGTPGLQ